MNVVGRCLAAIVVGAAMILPFPPFDLWFVAPILPAGIALLMRDRSFKGSAFYGLLVGLAFFIPFLYWTGEEVGPIPWLVLAIVQGLYFVPLGIGLMVVQRLPGWPVWTAAVWVADEALRGRFPYGGFTWGKLAFSQGEGMFLPLAQLGGAPLVSFAVAFVGGLLAWAIVTRRFMVRLLAVAVAAGVVYSGTLIERPAPNGDTVQVAVIQGNVPEAGLDFNAEKRAVTENHAEATHQLADDVRNGDAEQPDFVIWPENSSDVSPYHDRETYDTIDSAVRDVGVPTLIGSIVPTADEQNVKNTSIVWDPETGPGDTYVKRHPMPFGEYIPMRSLARRITDAVEHQPRDHVAGHKVGVLDLNGTTVGDVICFEVAFDDIVRDAVEAGGEVITVQTNNATFGFTPMSEQQLAMSQLRAVEHGRTVLVAATSGISAVVAPDGSIVDRSKLYTRDIMVTDVQLSTASTLATKVGAWPEWVLSGVAATMIIMGLGMTRRREEDDDYDDMAGTGDQGFGGRSVTAGTG